ncbi:MAG: hypothetical protein AAGI01_14465 [Myxococcota bacterium]
MSENQSSNSNGGSRRRRRRKRNRGGGGGGNHNGNSDRNNNRNSSSGRGRRGGGGGNSNGYKSKTPKDKFGGRDPRDDGGIEHDHEVALTPFELFCAYHMGITPDNKYRRPSARDVARRFDVSVDEMHDALRTFAIDNNSMDELDFDISLARLDVRVAPEGIDRREIARVHFDELVESHPRLRMIIEDMNSEMGAEMDELEI